MGERGTLIRAGRREEFGRSRRRPTSLVPALILGAFGLPACGELSIFDPPDTRVVGQTLGTLLAVSYTASLTNHALTVGNSGAAALTVTDGKPACW